MSKIKCFSFINLIFALFLLISNTSTAFADSWLPAPIIKGLVMTKNETDPEQTNIFTKDSYPFTISFTFDDMTLSKFSYDTVALLENCSFYPLSGIGEYSAFFDYENKTFTFHNMLYTGEGRTFTVTIADKGYVQTISFSVGNVLPDSDISEESSSEASSLLPPESSSKVESSSKASSSKESSSRTSSTRVSSLPASITPQIIVTSYSYGDNIASNIPFTTSIEITNTSGHLAAEELIVTFDQLQTGNDINILDSTNVKYIPFLGPGEKQTFEIKCISKEISDVHVQNLALSIDFQYYDIEGKDPVKGKNEAVLNFYTKENHTIRIERIQLPDEVYVNEIFDMKFRLVNLGLSTAKNVDISVLDGKNGKEISRTFVGLIQPSTAVSEPEIPLQFLDIGEYNLIFKAYYTENNELKEVSSPFTIFVTKRPIESESESEKKESVSSEESSSEESSEEEPVSKNPAIIVEKSENNLDDSLVLGIFVTVIMFIVGYILYMIFNALVKPRQIQKNEKISKTILKDLQSQNSKRNK